MLRAARFITGYDLEPDADLVDAVRELRGRLEIVSAERIRDELDKLLVVEEPGPGLWFLVDTGLAEEFLPELPALALEQDPIHRHKDVLAHTIAVVEKVRPDRLLRLAALLHDIGKPKTRSFGPGGVSFHHHEVVGARMARERMQALRYPPTRSRRSPGWSSSTCGSTPTGWAGPTARCDGTCDAGGALDVLASWPAATARRRTQRKALREKLAHRMGDLEEPASPSFASAEGAPTASRRPRRQPDHGAPRRAAGPRRRRHADDALRGTARGGALGEDEACRRLGARGRRRSRAEGRHVRRPARAGARQGGRRQHSMRRQSGPCPVSSGPLTARVGKVPNKRPPWTAPPRTN